MVTTNITIFNSPTIAECAAPVNSAANVSAAQTSPVMASTMSDDGGESGNVVYLKDFARGGSGGGPHVPTGGSSSDGGGRIGEYSSTRGGMIEIGGKRKPFMDFVERGQWHIKLDTAEIHFLCGSSLISLMSGMWPLIVGGSLSGWEGPAVGLGVVFFASSWLVLFCKPFYNPFPHFLTRTRLTSNPALNARYEMESAVEICRDHISFTRDASLVYAWYDRLLRLVKIFAKEEKKGIKHVHELDKKVSGEHSVGDMPNSIKHVIDHSILNIGKNTRIDLLRNMPTAELQKMAKTSNIARAVLRAIRIQQTLSLSKGVDQ